MIVIQHDLTDERFMFPNFNVNKETPSGFEQSYLIPRGFHLSLDQTPVPLTYQPDNAELTVVKWEANSKDPLNTMDKWRKP